MPPELYVYALHVLMQTTFFLALINPISKVVVLSAMGGEMEGKELRAVSLEATIVGLAILVLLALGGAPILTQFFHVQVHSLRIAGGVVLFIMGLQALMKGRFFEVSPGQKLRDVSIVPLASPMIAGPATITAAISETAHLGFAVTGPAIVLALAVNFAIMTCSLRIARWMTRFNLMGALIRMTGILVTAIAVQMALDGVQTWLTVVRAADGT
jgi:multiple antibiotic resistance protein